MVRQSTRGSGGGKSLRTLQTIKSKQAVVENDENVEPTTVRNYSATRRRVDAVGKHKTIRATFGGKKGLQEQLKRVRQGGKMMIR